MSILKVYIEVIVGTYLKDDHFKKFASNMGSVLERNHNSRLRTLLWKITMCFKGTFFWKDENRVIMVIYADDTTLASGNWNELNKPKNLLKSG